MNNRHTFPTARPVVPTVKALRGKRFSIPVIWIVPIVAALVAAYLLINLVLKNGPDITIYFSNGDGLMPGQTIVRYRGTKVGEVRDVELDRNGQRVKVEVRLERPGTILAREGSVFWVVRPEMSASGVRGLDTLVSGAYIQVEPGHGREQTEFTGSDETPMQNIPGALDIVLTTPEIRSLTPGAPVYYRGMEVGNVRALALNKFASQIIIYAQIKPSYAGLVRQNTVFWNAGGLDVTLKLFGVNVSAESMRSLVIGGIAFATPSPPGPPAAANSQFELHEKVEEKWLKWEPQILGWAGTNAPPTESGTTNTTSFGTLTNAMP